MASGAAYLFAILALGLPMHSAGQETGESGLAWQGCWEVATEPGDETQEPSDSQQLVCLAPGEDLRSLTLTAIVDGQVVRQHTLFTDGVQRPASEGGCSGWRRAFLSEDRRRLYLRSESACEGGTQSALSGASLMVSGDHWVDIHLLRVDDERELVIRHYRPLVSGSVPLPGGLPSARHAARLLAAAPLTADDVIEALQFVDPPVVEAMLLEGDTRFAMDSRLMLRLADADVPDEIVDLMVALSFPEYFAAAEAPPDPGPVVYRSYWTPWYSPYGYGFGHYYPHPHPPVTGPPAARTGVKLVRGHGYTRVEPTNPPPGGFTGFLKGAANTGGSGGTGAGSGTAGGGTTSGTSSSGANGGSDSSGNQGSSSPPRRRAVPR
jgi:uncharacterized membrane protein YgcG